jgi:plastocyanin
LPELGKRPATTLEEDRLVHLTSRGLSMRSLIRSTAIAAATFALILVGSSFATAAPTTAVKLQDDFFAPSKKTVKRGTVVRFKWAGQNPHNVTKVSGPGGPFASPTTWRQGVHFEMKFRKAGTYRLLCTLHSGMELKLRVVP